MKKIAFYSAYVLIFFLFTIPESTGAEYHKTVVWIPDNSYIHAVTIKSIFPGIGKCTKTIEIIQ